MFELIFLGTSASAPSVHRGLPSQIVIHQEHRFLIDAGEGTQRQILKSGLGFRKLNRLLITHSHLDHILGVGGLVSTFLRWETMDKLEIYGGKSALERIHDLLFKVVIRGTKPPFPIQLIPVTQGTIITEKNLTIDAFPVHHRGPDCYGYVFQEIGKRPFIEEKAKALDIPQGPWRRDLVSGKTASLPDGRRIKPDQVLGDFQEGIKLVIAGDTGETASLKNYCQDADGLVIEATYTESEVDMASQFSHLTARQAAYLAKESNAKQLYLTHISRRYHEKSIETEAKSVFPNTTVARDFDHFHIKR